MERNATLVFEMLAIFASFALTMVGAVAPPRDRGQSSQTEQQSQAAPDHALSSVDEARARARLLHETVHATLQIVHHEYYREDAYERAEDGVSRHVGSITLSSECLKCHLPSRTISKNRTAGLIITMPVEKH